MTLTNKQEEGLRIAVQRYKLGLPYTCIAGYAGSGKSTLVRFIIDALEVSPEEVCYVAFTGKAAAVLQQKGCPGATTAHKLLFKAKPTANGGFVFQEKKVLDEDYKVIVVDEVSMLPSSMWDILMKHRVYVLACGDPGQLPPVNPEDTNTILDHPHVFLDEIMRQAQESEIIRLSMHVREGKPLSAFEAAGAQVQIFNKNELSIGMMTWADQILCATNETRNEYNQIMRQVKGFGPEPQIGDKIISLRNNWEQFSTSGDWALTNGLIGTIADIEKKSFLVPKKISKKGLMPILCTTMSLDDGDMFEDLKVDYTCLTTGKPFLDPKETYLMRRDKALPDPPLPFNYAYALTTHKAQGSEWAKVLVVEERFPFSAEDHKRWLYTACTRASEKLVVIKK